MIRVLILFVTLPGENREKRQDNDSGALMDSILRDFPGGSLLRGTVSAPVFLCANEDLEN